MSALAPRRRGLFTGEENRRRTLETQLLELYRRKPKINALDGTGGTMPNPQVLEQASRLVIDSQAYLGRKNRRDDMAALIAIGSHLEYLFSAPDEQSFAIRFAARCHFA